VCVGRRRGQIRTEKVLKKKKEKKTISHKTSQRTTGSRPALITTQLTGRPQTLRVKRGGRVPYKESSNKARDVSDRSSLEERTDQHRKTNESWRARLPSTSSIHKSIKS